MRSLDLKGDLMTAVRARSRYLSTLPVTIGLLYLSALPAGAVEKGDWLVRAGIGHVAPTGKSETVPVVGGKGEAAASTNLAVNLTYMMTDHLGIEVLGAAPFKHDIEHDSFGKVARTKELPPTLILLYNFNPKANVRFYAGVGLNYTTFFSEKTTGALEGTSLKLDDSVGLAAEVGVDIDVGRNMFFNASLWRMDIDTEADSSLLGKFDVAIDPWAAFAGIGWRF